jgi:hypothetical protein
MAVAGCRAKAMLFCTHAAVDCAMCTVLPRRTVDTNSARFLPPYAMDPTMNSDSGKTCLGRDDAYEASAGPPCEPYRI